MNFISLFVLVAISLQLFSDAFRPSSFGIQPHRRKYSTIISFDAAINTPPTVNTVFTSESTSAYGADEKKTKKRSSADQVDNIEQKRKQTEVWRFLKRDINMSDKQSKTIHQLYPWLFDIDYEQKIKPIVELLRSYDFHNKVIRLIIKENPFVFQKEIPELQRRIDYLLEQTKYSNLQLIHY